MSGNGGAWMVTFTAYVLAVGVCLPSLFRAERRARTMSWEDVRYWWTFTLACTVIFLSILASGDAFR